MMPSATRKAATHTASSLMMSNDTPPFLLESEERKAGPCPRPSVPGPLRLITSQIDTAPKPPLPGCRGFCLFDYQSDRHCAKTPTASPTTCSTFDYQSDRHCAKTCGSRAPTRWRLITSQIDTAPKLRQTCRERLASLITSQIDTAPKRVVPGEAGGQV